MHEQFMPNRDLTLKLTWLIEKRGSDDLDLRSWHMARGTVIGNNVQRTIGQHTTKTRRERSLSQILVFGSSNRGQSGRDEINRLRRLLAILISVGTYLYIGMQSFFGSAIALSPITVHED
ncbi:hypothetical protein RRG08_028519 [Elysia crispata]|uniref:Uncharacterized protein n=1 Tax=Elysia crispata TaxID=231223 RepID=A0AAE0Y9H2_9GAST|nr:hypothetical protein RRG08_028519 [Elysia crispata]